MSLLNTLDELTQQLGERVPFAMRAMAQAAVDAGLIDGSKTSQERERALFKLMEQGKLISAEVLPHFGKAMSDLANNNDELAKALTNNLSPALGRASNSLVTLQKAMFDGLKPSLMFTLDGFNDLADESSTLSYFLGKVLGGAILTLSTIIRLPAAALIDLTYWMSETLGLSKETSEMFIGMAGTAIGATVGIWGLVKVVRALGRAYKFLKGSKEAVKMATETGKKGAQTTGGISKGVLGSAGKGLSRVGKLAGPAGVLYSTYEAATSTYNRLATTNERNDAIVKALTSQGDTKVTIDLNPNGLEDVIDTRVSYGNGQMIENAYMNLNAGGEK